MVENLALLNSNATRVSPFAPSLVINCQLVVMAVLAALMLVSGLTGAVSVLVGGLSAIIPNAVFAYSLFRRPPLASNAMRFVCVFFVGEWLKLLVSALLVIAAVHYLSVHLAALLGGFAAAYFACWLVPVWLKVKKRV